MKYVLDVLMIYCINCYTSYLVSIKICNINDDDDYSPKKEGEPAKEKGAHHKTKCHKGLRMRFFLFFFLDEVIFCLLSQSANSVSLSLAKIWDCNNSIVAE